MNNGLQLLEYHETVDRSRNAFTNKRKRNKVDVLFVDSVNPRLTYAFAVDFESSGQSKIIGRSHTDQIISCRVESRLIESICIDGGG